MIKLKKSEDYILKSTYYLKKLTGRKARITEDRDKLEKKSSDNKETKDNNKNKED